ncbi:MAG TPA: alpha-glycosidase [Ruminococcaceae bacterium]|nr:alpha-glycosidase [Oscillospiraceae bacterium]
MRPTFNSRDEQYRSPFGAQPQGQAVFFRICLPRNLMCSSCRLLVEENIPMGETTVTSNGMFWAGMEGNDDEWWDCHFTPQRPAVYFYWFEMETQLGVMSLSRDPDGKASIVTTGKVNRWQLTCYRPNLQTPDWLAGGIMYQIFPDRFARSGQGKDNIPNDRILRSDWGGQPHWQPDENGVIQNNDYFCGDLKGIEQRLDHLASLGVTCIYLNPIFEAHSNHRYNTADYMQIDPLLGTEEDFRSLVDAARQVGIGVILDGVFSHTGSDSLYFNQNGRYDSPGAWQTRESPYFSWYHFEHWPNHYKAWWGVSTLPEVDETDLGFIRFITGKDGIVGSRIHHGAAGWRLDVADELPDEFLDVLYSAVKAENPEAVVLGEVWEDASNKTSHGGLRRYLLGGQLDSVMNYPFRDAIIQYLRGGEASEFMGHIMDIVENYPPAVTRLLMNHIGTHDTERALTALAGQPAGSRDRVWQSKQQLSEQERQRGLSLMRLASALQYTLPGVPCVFYGDEAGMEGYRDPFNRGCYPWGKEDADLVGWYRRLGKLRAACPALKDGMFITVYGNQNIACYERSAEGSKLLCAVNAGDQDSRIALPNHWHQCTVCMGEGSITGSVLHLPPVGCAIVTIQDV